MRSVAGLLGSYGKSPAGVDDRKQKRHEQAYRTPGYRHRRDMNPTSIEVIATALGGTYTARGDAVAVVEDLKAAGFAIVATRDRCCPSCDGHACDDLT